jgi:hypothetical protein
MQTLALHPIRTDVAVMAGLALLFIAPAVWQFNRRD